MVAAGVRAFFVNRAAARLGVEINAVVIGAPGQGENTVLEIEMRDLAGFDQALGDLLGRLTRFEFIHQTDPHQITHPHFNRHGAAGSLAFVTQAGAIFQPASQPVEVGEMNQRFSGGWCKWIFHGGHFASYLPQCEK